MKAVTSRNTEIHEPRHVGGVLVRHVKPENIVIERRRHLRDIEELYLDENNNLFTSKGDDYEKVSLNDSVEFLSDALTLEEYPDSEYGPKFAEWCSLIKSQISTPQYETETPSIVRNDAFEALLEKISGNDQPDTFRFVHDFAMSPTIELPMDQWIDLAFKARQNKRTIGDEIAFALKPAVAA